MAPGPIDDDRLRLVFTCCHPVLSMEARVALTLTVVSNLSTAAIGRVFLTSESTMGQRLLRAKRITGRSAARSPRRRPRVLYLGRRGGPTTTWQPRGFGSAGCSFS